VTDLRHKVEVELKTTEERTEQATIKHLAKLQVTGGGAFGMNNLELDLMLTSLKDEVKSYADRVVSQNAEKLIEQRHNSEMLLEGRCNAFSVELERKYRELFLQYKAELELGDTDRRVHQKEREAEMLSQFHKIKSDVTMRLDLFEQKEIENKMWVERQMHACVQDLSRLVDKKMSENEAVVKKLLLKNSSSQTIQSVDIRSLKERNLLEYVDTMIKSLKFELSNDIDDERTRKNNRLDEVTRLINTHKSLLDEHVR